MQGGKVPRKKLFFPPKIYNADFIQTPLVKIISFFFIKCILMQWKCVTYSIKISVRDHCSCRIFLEEKKMVQHCFFPNEELFWSLMEWFLYGNYAGDQFHLIFSRSPSMTIFFLIMSRFWKNLSSKFHFSRYANNFYGLVTHWTLLVICYRNKINFYMLTENHTSDKVKSRNLISSEMNENKIPKIIFNSEKAIS